MCDHCGCRGFPVIADLAEDHLLIHEIAGQLRRAIGVGDDRAARQLLVRLVGLLEPHVAAEESGLFAELRTDQTIRPTIERLCAEHDRLATGLRLPSPDHPDWTEALAALDELAEHIDKEEYGVFPAAVILLSMPAWDRITRRHEARYRSVPPADLGRAPAPEQLPTGA